jgi:hypothetical protein
MAESPDMPPRRPGAVSSDLGRLDPVNGKRIGAGWVCRHGGPPLAWRCTSIPTMTSPDDPHDLWVINDDRAAVAREGPLSTALAGQGAGPSVLRVRDPRALPAGPTGEPMRNGGGAGLITVRQVPATAARESNL